MPGDCAGRRFAFLNWDVSETKIRLYLLNIDHREGRSKARFFLARALPMQSGGSLSRHSGGIQSTIRPRPKRKQSTGGSSSYVARFRHPTGAIRASGQFGWPMSAHSRVWLPHTPRSAEQAYWSCPERVIASRSPSEAPPAACYVSSGTHALGTMQAPVPTAVTSPFWLVAVTSTPTRPPSVTLPLNVTVSPGRTGRRKRSSTMPPRL